MDGDIAADLAALGEAPPGADLGTWAIERGWLGEGSSLSLRAFLENELRCARIKRAKDLETSAGEEALAEMRTRAVCEELGLETLGAVGEALADDPDRARALASLARPLEISPLLETINASLYKDFCTRRELLLKRCDVTIQSFLWGDKARGHESEIETSIRALRRRLSKTPVPFAVADAALMSRARAHSLASLLDKQHATAASIKKHVIGDVPSRGGDVTKARQHDEGDRRGGGGRHHRRSGGKRSRK
ncbi:hypothetical protein CTAYLR_005263 [Chrysophaeum taylorii]|uniref:Protein FAM98A n=1 Tax=Chrysophaeum taylorii TaxID=2483200 RepID=A0AAD7UKK6_9STRA|nr:hypothetical protein CTAYLR_005263 [Chrysophaeum taylorii]